MANPMTFEGALIWVGALSTLALYSILYKENPVYRAVEHLFLGLATGYGLYVIWKEILFKLWLVPMLQEGQWAWILAFVGGMMYFTILSNRLSWMSRLIMTTMMGLAAGLTFRKFYGEYVPQIGASFRPLVVVVPAAGGIDWPATLFTSFTNTLFVVCLVSVTTYFFFSFEQKSKVVVKTAATGRWLMMVAFGAMFGSTVMARMSLFIGRLDFLFREWIHLIK